MAGGKNGTVFASRCGGAILEGEIFGGASTGAVICHPHPLFGGNMHNSVVGALFDAMAGAGFSALRFNFRGVGGSQGGYGGGKDEIGDVLGAIDHLKKSCGCGEIILAGYSFGAAVALNALSESGAGKFIAVALPTEMGREYYGELPVPVSVESFVASGDMDEISGLDKIGQIARFANPPRKLELRGCDHFFSNLESLGKLCENAVDFILKGKGETA